MSETCPSPRDIKRMLGDCRSVAVVGCSPNPQRDSHKVARYLLEKGYTVIPVNPQAQEILGQKCYASLEEIGQPVDMVNVFRDPSHAPELARQAARLGAKVLWLQLGVKSPQAAQTAQQAGLDYVEDRCLMVEHHRQGGGQ